MKEKCTCYRSYLLYIPLHKLHHKMITSIFFILLSNLKRQKFNLFTISLIIPAYAFLTIIVPLVLVPKQHIVPPSILQQCFVEFIYCQWLFCFTLTFKMHLTYLPPIFLDENDIMLTNRTITMLKSTLDIISSCTILQYKHVYQIII